MLGGIAGHQVEKNTRTVTRYDISVRMDNGEHRVVTVKDAPMWREGDRVAIRDGQLVAPQADQPAPYPSSGAARFDGSRQQRAGAAAPAAATVVSSAAGARLRGGAQRVAHR